MNPGIFLLCVLGGYLIGSIPTAFILVRKKSGLDIRKEGSGNVGGFNAFDVTRSKVVGGLVILLDAIKGWVVVTVAAMIGGSSFAVIATAFLAALVGHNYPVWLRFHGGRGLATAAGGIIAIGLSFMVAWVVTWVVVYLVKKDILRANLTAIILAPVLVILLPDAWIAATMTSPITAGDYRVLGAILSVVHLVSHHDVVRDLVRPQSTSV